MTLQKEFQGGNERMGSSRRREVERVRRRGTQKAPFSVYILRFQSVVQWERSLSQEDEKGTLSGSEFNISTIF